jgi:hypothetical protein
MGHMRSVMIAALILGIAVRCTAQDRTGDVYMIAGLVLPYQAGPTGESYQTYRAAPGGWTFRWSIAGGVFLGTKVSGEVEYSTTGLMLAREPSRYRMTFNEERRDRFLWLGTRLHLTLSDMLRLEPVAGIVITFPVARSQTEYGDVYHPDSDEVVIGPWEDVGLRKHFGPGVGCDLRFGGRHLAVLPTFRLMHTRAGPPAPFPPPYGGERPLSGHYPGGYPSWTFRTGVAVRFDF